MDKMDINTIPYIKLNGVLEQDKMSDPSNQPKCFAIYFSNQTEIKEEDVPMVQNQIKSQLFGPNQINML